MKASRVFSHDYGEMVSVYITQYFADTNAAVIFDVGTYFHYVDINDRAQAVKELGLEELSYKELENSDFVILEFGHIEDMEEYLFKIEHLNVFAKFYKLGELFEELPEEN